MPELQDVSASSLYKDDPQKQVESVVRQVNQAFRAISNEARTTIVRDDAGDPRLLIGYQENGFSNGSVGAKLSQQGVDVAAATNDQLIWSTDFNSFKIVASGTVSQTLANAANVVSGAAGSNPQTFSIAHNLGYVPTFLVYMTAPSTFVEGAVLFQLPHTTFFNNGGVNDGLFFTYFHATADSTNLNIKYNHLNNTDYSPNAPIFTVRYYLMRETASSS